MSLTELHQAALHAPPEQRPHALIAYARGIVLDQFPSARSAIISMPLSTELPFAVRITDLKTDDSTVYQPVDPHDIDAQATMISAAAQLTRIGSKIAVDQMLPQSYGATYDPDLRSYFVQSVFPITSQESSA